MAQSIPEMYGSLVFNDKVMRSKLPKDMYKALKKTIENGTHLELDVANSVAVAMKEWATENGATHYTHWFQPMTNVTAEKHDSFISPTGDGQVIMDFSGKELVKGEPDASSFPSGGLRATFEARGYTAWDPTSPAFIKDKTLYIPTAFCSYSGEALDKKTPLLRSMDVLNKEAVRILHILGNKEVRHIDTTVGPEQEYFLVDKDLYKKRKDLIFCGRTLLGASAPKGQEMEDHYFGALKPRVAAYMHDLDEELWKLGIPAKTKHNEVAPAQHELAPVFDTTNVAVDHNQLTMEIMKKVADKHNMVCLLHEKPFEGINGSGKHNNWSMSTDTGVNLLDPGKTPAENTQFLVFLVAVIKAVDDYADLLRVSVASAGNDHRLGANEAPPAIVSIFLGDELTDVLKSIENDTFFSNKHAIQMDIGAKVLPHFIKDTTDRNRTSPFAFTGNKFEFRMLGSAASVANPNIVLNTAVAEVLAEFSASLKDVPEEEMESAVHALLKKTIEEHKRIIFNGNGYTDEWVEEAEKRGLYNLKTTPDALPHFIAEKNIELFTKHGIFTREELFSRYDIWLENYYKTINIESNTLAEMIQKQVIPSVYTYVEKLADTAAAKKSVVADISVASEAALISKLSTLADTMAKDLETLKADTAKALASSDDVLACSKAYQETVLEDMEVLRKSADEAEALIPDELLPYPTYDELLFSI
ncbi:MULTISPECIES: glutamine synthetase III [Clostridia]|uniref:glutamine synthetase III family protein n=1 Tax=Clostridia TaxID=186801 RepID=UPI000E4B8123|nr:MULTISPECIES: glutamine synthetase III [Clostridia]MCC2726177.1 glutamine synthetase III [Blautia sp. MSK22_86]NSF57886.1 glutamine synthetase type III [Blautia massiliensis (ex Durand et al. 2017)]NSK73231.1 glutamine synthetase type III [Blautia massiliensis (ex Durand et al. 2017)]RHR05088.1 glutamine synthetase type III [Ruminococcus sp. AF20-12LB]